MTHPENLIAWLDKEVSEQDAAVIDAHVQSCAACQDALSVYREAGNFVSDMLESTSREAPRRTRWRAVVAFSIAAALALMLLPIRPVAHRESPLADFQPSAIRISIPAEAMLPPGVAPEGFEFVADIETNPLP